jgi:hypothetical protein
VVLIGRNGIAGAGQATCASFLVQLLTTAWLLRRALHHRAAVPGATP